jgi:uncharacterized protein YndB with AHSA1/START domain
MLDCHADRLWKLVTRPEFLGQWLGATIFSDTQYGGFTVTTGAHTQLTGLVTACVPPHYFKITWDDPPHQPSTVLVDVVPGTRGAHLILTHGGLAHGRIDDYDSFWSTTLNRLTQYAAGRLRSSRTRWQLPGTAGGA